MTDFANISTSGFHKRRSSNAFLGTVQRGGRPAIQIAIWGVNTQWLYDNLLERYIGWKIANYSMLDLDRFTSRRSTIFAPNGVIATSQPLAAQAGINIMNEGGNAFDAAISAAAVLNVVEPASTGLGGDASAIYRTSGGEIMSMISCGGAPNEISISKVRDSTSIKKGCNEMPARGPYTVTVPGAAKGWETIIEKYGNLPLEEVLAPAITYSQEGYPVTEIISKRWQDVEDILTTHNAKDTYFVNSKAPNPGETIKLPNLGESLKKIGENGADIVYDGVIGEKIVKEVRKAGGYLSMADLSNFKPEFAEPVSTTYYGNVVYESPPPSQGLITLEALNIMEEIDINQYTKVSPESIHCSAEAMKLSIIDGHRHITDPIYGEIPDITSKKYAANRAKEIDCGSSSTHAGFKNIYSEHSNTVVISVGDREGNLITFINSLFNDFGSGLVAGDSGIVIQNRGRSFSLDRDHPNSLQPGKRPFHTLIPALVKFDQNDWATFGVMGGDMQPQGHVQVLSNILNHEMPLQAALDHPRWRIAENGDVDVEARLDDHLLAKLPRFGHNIKIKEPDNFGGAQIVRRNVDTLSAATEPRKDGVAIGY